MMAERKITPYQKEEQYTIVQGGGWQASPILKNLMRDTSTPMLIYIAEQNGLRRIPGLGKDDLIKRILHHLPPTALRQLEQDLITMRFGSLSVDDLLRLALHHDARNQGRAGMPRLDQVSAADAILIEGQPGRWLYTMRGHDVTIDLENRRLHCDCTYFRYASRRMALCKHLATAFKLIPVVYAREALIDLLVTRTYGSSPSTNWQFVGSRAA